MVSPVGSFMFCPNPTEDSLPKWHLGSFSFADASWVRFTEGVSWQRLKKSCEDSGEVRRGNTYNMSILETL